MEYSVCFLFDESGKTVLLQKKNRTMYASKWNGVGGSYEINEDKLSGAAREIFEETGHKVKDLNSLKHLGTLEAINNCKDHGEPCILHFYGIIVSQSEVDLYHTDEELEWWDVDSVIESTVKSPLFAGNGNLQYFVNVGRIILFEQSNFYHI